jgi:hypothetical protein
MSLKMAHKVILPPKKNYIPQFLKQRDINSYYSYALSLPSALRALFLLPRQELLSCKLMAFPAAFM